MVLAAVFDLNRVIHHATRFTDEIFALLISANFIIDALASPFQPVGLYYYYQGSHASHEGYDNDPEYSYLSTASLSLILGLATTSVAFMLRGMKFSPYLCYQTVRTLVTDVSVTAAILFFTGQDRLPSSTNGSSECPRNVRTIVHLLIGHAFAFYFILFSSLLVFPRLYHK